MFSSPVIELFCILYHHTDTVGGRFKYIATSVKFQNDTSINWKKKSEIKDYKMINGTKLMLLVSTY